MSAQSTSALKKGGSAQSTTNNHVVLVGVEGHEKKAGSVPAVATPKTEVTAPPPPAGFIKDEVEMLRAGFKNKHGEAVKSQSVNIEL